jgi:pilus assembly protein CpaB
MRGKSMILLAIALGCGLVASIGISQVMERGSTPVAAPPTVEIFVTTTDINIGDKLDASNVKLEKWPADKVPEGALTDLAQVEGQFAGSRLFEGEPIVAQRLQDNDTSDSKKIPDGYRAMAIKVTMDTAVANLIRPGDRVDVIGFFRKSQDVPETSTRAVLRGVRVFSVNSSTTREREQGGDTTKLQTVSLLIKDDQVEPLMLADELGQLRLSLRRPDDADNEATEGLATTRALFQQGPGYADDPRPAPRPQTQQTAQDGGGLLDLLKAAQTTPPLQLARSQPAFSMVVHTPDGIQVFNWQDRNQLPEGMTSNVTVPPVPALTAPQGEARASEAPVLVPQDHH